MIPDALSLRRGEAEERAALLKVGHVSVQLDLTDPGAFLSCATITFAAATPGAAPSWTSAAETCEQRR